MLAGYNLDQERLFFFDNGKRKRWQKRQKKPIDSLPITLLRDVRPSVALQGGKPDATAKNRKELTFVKEVDGEILNGEENEAGAKHYENEQTNGLPSKKKNKNQLEIRLVDLDEDDDEDTQKFLFEEAKFSAPSLLAQIEKFLVLIKNYRTHQREELQQLNEEIHEIYGEHWNLDSLEERASMFDIQDELYHRLCSDFEQLAAGTVYIKRQWQTSVYRDLAALHESKGNIGGDFMSLASSPDAASKAFAEKNFRTPLDEREKLFEKEKKADKADTQKFSSILGIKDSRLAADNGESDASPMLITRQESRASISKPRAKNERFKYAQDKDKGDRDRMSKGGPKIVVAPQEGANDDDAASLRTWEVNFDKSYLLQNQGQPFLPGSVISFSMTSKTCRNKGWIVRHDGTEELESKSILVWACSKLKLIIKQKEEEEAKARLINEDGPLLFRNYGDSKRENTIKYKQGVSWAKFLSKKKSEIQNRFLTVLPDGSSCCYYHSGRVAVITSKSPNNSGFYTIAFSDEPNSKMLACFTPSGRGCCNYSDSTVRFVVTSKHATFFDPDGIPTKKWKWTYGKLMNPETIQLNDNLSIRLVSHSTITLHVNIEGETTKFQLSPAAGATEPDVQSLGFLMTGEAFSSNSAAQSLFQKKKLTREEKRMRNMRREAAKNIANNISAECLAERMKDLEEKFPERKEIEMDAPFLLDLNRLQRRVKNIVFDWMEHYRMATGISRPSKMKLLMQKKNRMNSANSLPGTLPSSEGRLLRSTPRAPSAPPLPKSVKGKLALINLKSSEAKTQSKDLKRPKSTEVSFSETPNDVTDIQIELPPKTADSNGPTTLLSPKPRNTTQESQSSRTHRQLLLPKDGCPVALRLEILGDKYAQCRCDKRRMPFITDTEYDIFINDHIPKTQLIIVSIVSSRFPKSSCDDMLDNLYYERNKTHSLPCVQSRYASYRLLRYDMATANGNEVPLLLRRHNTAPGMFLMYMGGRLLFADHIFNGYGNAKRDFLKQVMRTQKDSLKNNSLALDFRFSPSPSRRGPRTAWGGQIGTPLLINPVANAKTWDIDDSPGNELPALISTSSELELFGKERDKRKQLPSSSFFSFGILSNLNS